MTLWYCEQLHRGYQLFIKCRRNFSTAAFLGTLRPWRCYCSRLRCVKVWNTKKALVRRWCGLLVTFVVSTKTICFHRKDRRDFIRSRRDSVNNWDMQRFRWDRSWIINQCEEDVFFSVDGLVNFFSLHSPPTFFRFINASFFERLLRLTVMLFFFIRVKLEGVVFRRLYKQCTSL